MHYKFAEENKITENINIFQLIKSRVYFESFEMDFI